MREHGLNMGFQFEMKDKDEEDRLRWPEEIWLIKLSSF